MGGLAGMGNCKMHRFDLWVLEFMISNITGNNQRGNCISLDFNFCIDQIDAFCSYPYLPTLPFCAGVSRTNDVKFRNLPLAGPLPRESIESPAFGYFNPQSYFSGFFITVNRSKQTMGDHLKPRNQQKLEPHD
jgi:hypothetical protein